MKKQNVIAVCLLLAPIFFTSCGNSKLSQTEAQKQLQVSLENGKNMPDFEISGGQFGENQVPPEKIKQLNSVKDAGFIDYKLVPWVNRYLNYGNRFTVVTLYMTPKIKPYLLRATEWFGEQDFTVNGVDNLIGVSVLGGTYKYEPEILSITEAAANAQGKIVSIVTYKKHISLDENELGKAADLHFNNNDTAAYNVNFVKTQDGWKLDTQ